MKTDTIPDVAFRAAIHNQIYATRYYHVSRYERSASGKLAYAESWGYRSGGSYPNKALGMTAGQAREEARRLNRESGWADVPKDQRPSWMLV